MLMRSLRLSLLVCSLFGAVCLQTGCAGWMGQGRTMQLFRPRTADQQDELEKPANQQWANEVGQHARTGRTVEVDNDPLYKYITSSRARDIDRSLGIIGPDDK
jgi:hypothetical protein